MKQRALKTTGSATWWSAALVVGGIAAAMTPAILLAAGGAGGGFDSVVRGIESRYHVHANKIPFMGLISLVAGHATHGGVHSIHVAEIEHMQEPVDGAELNALVASRMGPGWQRIVRETSRSGDEQSLIYVKPEGARLGMLVVDLDHQEMDVVEISINPDKLSSEIAEHRHSREADDSGDKPDSRQDSDDSE
jgi:hypothetical protein